MPIFRACVVSARSDGLSKVATDPTYGKCVSLHVGARASSIAVCSAAESAGAAYVGARNHFQLVAVGIGKVDSASTIGVIDLAGTPAHRISPMVDAPFVDSAKDSVEICLTDKEGIMLRSDWALGVGEVKRNAVV
jgi:hypothetical protein